MNSPLGKADMSNSCNPNSACLLLALPQHQITGFQEKLMRAELAAATLAFPVLQLKTDPELTQGFDWKRLPEFSWLILSSSFGAKSFFELWPEKLPTNLKIAAVGPSVAEVIRAQGYQVDLQPPKFNSEALQKALLQAERPTGKAFLLVTGTQSASDELELALEDAGAKVEKLQVYQALMIENPDWDALQKFAAGQASKKIICFSSPEGVKAFYKLLMQKSFSLPEAICVCLGPATTAKAQKLFPSWTAHCAPEYSYNGMIELLTNLTAQ